jgi:hypothetical protein
MASERLTPGLTAEITTVVDDKLVVKHMGGEGVLSTTSDDRPYGTRGHPGPSQSDHSGAEEGLSDKEPAIPK